MQTGMLLSVYKESLLIVTAGVYGCKQGQMVNLLLGKGLNWLIEFCTFLHYSQNKREYQPFCFHLSNSKCVIIVLDTLY